LEWASWTFQSRNGLLEMKGKSEGVFFYLFLYRTLTNVLLLPFFVVMKTSETTWPRNGSWKRKVMWGGFFIYFVIERLLMFFYFFFL
jgi:hypothetical protein